MAAHLRGKHRIAAVTGGIVETLQAVLCTVQAACILGRVEHRRQRCGCQPFFQFDDLEFLHGIPSVNVLIRINDEGIARRNVCGWGARYVQSMG